MTHFLIFLRNLEMPIGNSTDYTVILRSYIEFLHFQKKQYLIPLYISYLPEEDSINTYAKVLVSVTDPEQRAIHLKLAKKYNLDINNSIRKAVADVFEETERVYDNTSFASPTNAVDDTDKRLYRTIEWFIDASLWADALHSIVSLYQMLLGKGKFEAAYQFGSRISCGTILKMYDTNLSVNLEHVEIILDNNERIQILEYDKLISILADIKLWGELFQEMKASTKFVSSNPPKQWREKTLMLVRELASKVNDFSRNWMIESIHAYKEIDPETANLLTSLRLLYVPFVILELARIYIEAQLVHPAFLKEAANLSNMVSSEELKLYELFLESGTLGTFLDRMTQAVTDGVANGEQGIYD
jgi:nuclear pore complex protein Nup107